MPATAPALSWGPFPKIMYGQAGPAAPDPAVAAKGDAQTLSRLLRHHLRARDLGFVEAVADRLLRGDRHRDLACLYHARLAQLAGRFDAALDWLDQAAKAGLPAATVAGDRGLVLCAAGRPSDGADLLRHAIQGGMVGHSILVNAITAHRTTAQQPALLAALEGLPRPAWGLAAVAEARLACLGDLGRTEDAARLLNIDHFLSAQDLTPDLQRRLGPDALPHLQAELSARPHFVPDPVGHTTRYGQQSKQLLVPPCVATALLLDRIQRAVAHFLNGLTGQAAHPFMAGRPRRARLEAWTVVTEQGGHQTDHIHPGGWLSGVFYVAVPPAPEPVGVLDVAEGNDPAGALEIPVPFRDGTAAWPVRRVRPRPGLLLIFPSYYRHRTIPTVTPEPRLCVAFDVVAMR